jgi:hypothetical protein
MSIHSKEIEEYLIPLKKTSGYKLTFHFLSISLIVIFAAFVLIPLGTDTEVILLKVFFAVFSIFFLYIWLYTGIFKKQYLELTDDYIRIRTAFGTKTIKWNQVQDIQVFTQSHNTMLGIILKEKARKRKETFWNLINDMFGGMFSVRIPLSQFPDIDIEKLYSTMINKLIKLNENSTNAISDNVDSYSVKPDVELSNNYLIILIKLLLLSIGMGLVYGLSIYIFKSNIVIIPIFGSIAIIYFYSKLYKEQKINILTRIIVGLICALQVFIGVIFTIFLESKLSFDINNLANITKQYFGYLIIHPVEQGIIIFISILCFGYGAFQGYKFKFQKKIEKIFMKKSGKHYYKKNGRFITIYLKDPVLCNKQQDGMYMLQIFQDCLIEKGKKGIKGLCIPTKAIDELAIVINYDDRVSISDTKYYKIDLDGKSNYQRYVFPCVLIMNNKKEVELIQIEI